MDDAPIVAKRSLTSASALLGAAGLSAALVGCLTPVPTEVGPLIVTPASASVSVGDTVKLTVAAVAVGDASGSGANPTVRWSSSNTGVATVTATGLVTAVAPGSATITATSNGRSGAATITVAPRPPPGTVEDLTVDAVTDSSVSLAFTEVTDGGRRPPAYDVPYPPPPLSSGPGAHRAPGTWPRPLTGT